MPRGHLIFQSYHILGSGPTTESCSPREVPGGVFMQRLHICACGISQRVRILRRMNAHSTLQSITILHNDCEGAHAENTYKDTTADAALAEFMKEAFEGFDEDSLDWIAQAYETLFEGLEHGWRIHFLHCDQGVIGYRLNEEGAR